MTNPAHLNNPIQCPHCDKIAKNQFGLEGHIRFSHRDIAQKKQSDEQTQSEQPIRPLEADNQEFASAPSQPAINQPQSVKQPLNAPQQYPNQQAVYQQPYPIIYNPQFPSYVQQQQQERQQFTATKQPQQLPQPSSEWQLDEEDNEQEQPFNIVPKKRMVEERPKPDKFDKLIYFLLGLAIAGIAIGFWLYFYIQEQIKAIPVPGMPG